VGKIALPVQSLILARLVLLVGANVGGKPNFMEVGGGGSVSSDPPMLALPIRHERYTLKGILENNTLSVNIPSVDLVREADYCGIISGADADKVKDCNFEVFYGKLATAPMLEQCAANMECRVEHTISTKSHAIIIARIEGAYMSEEYLINGKPDFEKLELLLWSSSNLQYYGIGKPAGKSFSIGRELKAWGSVPEGKTYPSR
jgi:flavin reductase (DIM6/NTAB) family NADH-FMN oxidoreductase RutF